MMQKNTFLAVGMGLMFSASACIAAEKNVDPAANTKMEISIYNNNLAFVKDTRKVDLSAGANEIAFVGVSSQIRPETAMLWGNNIVVREQNYNYNLMTPANILQGSIGKKVKTAFYNEQTGETTYDVAEILDAGYNKPVLKFSYGIETDFPGRIIYEEVPEGLRTKPTLVADVLNKAAAAEQNLELSYLTSGLSWKADYVADLTPGNTLNLNAWITLKNESGIDYNNASVQLIAGSVNQVAPVMPRPIMMARAAKGINMEMAAMDTASMPSSEAFADYYLYNLPVKTAIKDQQTKQVSLMTKEKVKYAKEYKMNSPLYFYYNSGENEFTKANPQVVYKLNNVKEDGLGLALPQGTIRFFETDSKGNQQFIGESSLNQLAEGEKTELSLGQAFDIFAAGKIASVKKISDKISEASAEITFHNAKDEAAEVIFAQNLNGSWEMISESSKSNKKNASTAEWKINIPAHGQETLKFTVRLSKKG